MTIYSTGQLYQSFCGKGLAVKVMVLISGFERLNHFTSHQDAGLSITALQRETSETSIRDLPTHTFRGGGRRTDG
jgi:hypothetical protein